MPEYGRATGGAISAVTKSGGNEFHGSVFGTWTPGGLAGPPKQVATVSAVINSNVAPAQHRRLRRHPRRLHHQGQAVVLRRLSTVRSADHATPAPGRSTTPTDSRDGLATSRAIPNSTQRLLRRRARLQVHRQAHLPHQPGPPPQRVGHRHADQRRWRRPRSRCVRRTRPAASRPRRLRDRHVQRPRRHPEHQRDGRRRRVQRLLPRQEAAPRHQRRLAPPEATTACPATAPASTSTTESRARRRLRRPRARPPVS